MQRSFTESQLRLLEYLACAEEVGSTALRHLAFLRPRLRRLREQVARGYYEEQHDQFVKEMTRLLRDLIEL